MFDDELRRTARADGSKIGSEPIDAAQVHAAAHHLHEDVDVARARICPQRRAATRAEGEVLEVPARCRGLLERRAANEGDHLVEMGMMQGQNWNLEELAALILKDPLARTLD